MKSETQLRPNCLNFMELLAQNIALISPTMTAALIIPLMFQTTGGLGWLAYAIGAVMLLFVAFNLNQFAKRTAGSGSMYLYTSMGLGPTTGSLSGWCLIWAYLFIGLAGTTGFTIFATTILGYMGLSMPPTMLYIICILSCFILAYKDIVVSQVVMLILEGLSVTLITILCAIVLFSHGLSLDITQFTLPSGGTKVVLSNLGFGVVVAIFSLVGFESSTAFGEEAKNPLINIPRSIIWSIVFAGIFFVVVCYTETMGTKGYSQTLDQIATPLNVLASMYKVPSLAIPLSIGAMVSFYALALSCMNAGARVIYAMSKHGMFAEEIRASHPHNKTPHVALTFMAVFMFLVVIFFQAMTGLTVQNLFNDCGTMGAFGFLGAYTLICLAAPFYLKKNGLLKPLDVILCVSALVLLALPAYGTFFPVPAATPPESYYPYVFVGYVIIGVIKALAFKKTDPAQIKKIENELIAMHPVTAPS